VFLASGQASNKIGSAIKTATAVQCWPDKRTNMAHALRFMVKSCPVGCLSGTPAP
jgi:hypothetical protein